MEGIHYTNRHYNDNPAFIQGTMAGRAKALQDFRRQKEAEKSEFAAEFARLRQAGSKPAFGLLETVGLTPLLVWCEQALRETSLELLWIDSSGGSWEAACLQGEAEALERGISAGLSAAKRFNEAAMYHVFRDASPALARWFRLGRSWRGMKDGEQTGENSSNDIRGGYMLMNKGTGDEGLASEIQRKVELQNTANLLEYTDTELRQLIRQSLSDPEQLPPSRLNSMHKEELVDYYNRMQHGRLN